MTPGLDLALPVRDLPPRRALELALEAERGGWAGVWLSEVLDLEAIAMAAVVAATTERVRVGTAIVPISTRSAATLAMAASTIERLAPGRFHLGLGVSTPTLVDQRHDRPVRRPLAEARGTLAVLRAALAGQRVDHEADPRVRGLRIVPPSAPPPVLLAALGAQMTQLAVEAADGLLLNLVPADAAGRRAAAARLARGEAYETLLLVRTIVDPSAAEALALRRELAGYVLVPAYGRALEELGLDVGPARHAATLDEAAAVLPDAVVELLSCTGPAAGCWARLLELRALGVTPLVVPSGGREAAERTLAALTPATMVR